MSDTICNPALPESGDVSRRTVLKTGLTVTAIAAAGPLAAAPATSAPEWRGAFTPLSWTDKDTFLVPEGYTHEVVIRWGDPLVDGAPEFDHSKLSPAAQAQQMGYNNDFVGFLPLPYGSANSDHGLLCVSCEYTDPHMMYSGFDGDVYSFTAEQVAIDMAAHGLAIIEVRRDAEGRWGYVAGSALNRRCSGHSAFAISGPAAGDDAMKTSYDNTGTMVLGTVNNCAGGLTPWGTWLQAEENFHGYFAGDPNADELTKSVYKTYGIKAGKSGRGWDQHEPRFDLAKEPNEANRFGWVVEIDPYDPASMPVKRTALGRFKHEAATTVVATGGNVVVYSGDDQRFEHLYKFVSRGTYSATDRAHNSSLLDDGVLYVAKFHDDGRGEWMPLVFGQGPLTKENGWQSQADVLIRTRQAAKALGATDMDRPEDVEASPVTGKIYMALTNNSKRKPEQRNAANPREHNQHGHIIEMVEHGGDHTALGFKWEILLLCGPVEEGGDYRGHADASPVSCPDNVAFDKDGNLWIATDGQTKSGANDAVYKCPVEGPQRGRTQQFMSGLPGGEVCGPCFTPDNTTFFCAIQHPGADVKGSTYDNPATRWPDYTDGVPPRPSVVAIRRQDGGIVGM